MQFQIVWWLSATASICVLWEWR